jgi:hypothetical protein
LMPLMADQRAWAIIGRAPTTSRRRQQTR